MAHCKPTWYVVTIRPGYKIVLCRQCEAACLCSKRDHGGQIHKKCLTSNPWRLSADGCVTGRCQDAVLAQQSEHGWQPQEHGPVQHQPCRPHRGGAHLCCRLCGGRGQVSVQFRPQVRPPCSHTIFAQDRRCAALPACFSTS